VEFILVNYPSDRKEMKYEKLYTAIKQRGCPVEFILVNYHQANGESLVP